MKDHLITRQTKKTRHRLLGWPAAGGQLKLGEPWLPEFLLKSFAGSSPSRAQKPKSFPHSAMGRLQTFHKRGNLATASPRLPRTESRSSPHGAPATRDQSPQLSAPRPPHLCPCRAFHVERPPSSPPGACLLDTVHKVFQIQHPARWPLCYFLPSARSRLRFLN